MISESSIHPFILKPEPSNPQIWDAFMDSIEPFAKRIPYMVGTGNHEYDYQRECFHAHSRPFFPAPVLRLGVGTAPRVRPPA